MHRRLDVTDHEGRSLPLIKGEHDIAALPELEPVARGIVTHDAHLGSTPQPWDNPLPGADVPSTRRPSGAP